VGQVLKGAVPGAEEEGGAEEGVTWRVWKELPPSEEEEAAEEQADGEEAAPKPPALPEYLHVENVIRDAAVRHFGVPKLGAYLAVPVTYASGIHDDGIGTAAPPPTEAAEEGAEPAAAAPSAPTGEWGRTDTLTDRHAGAPASRCNTDSIHGPSIIGMQGL
jgi:hypothetical protein